MGDEKEKVYYHIQMTLNKVMWSENEPLSKAEYDTMTEVADLLAEKIGWDTAEVAAIPLTGDYGREVSNGATSLNGKVAEVDDNEDECECFPWNGADISDHDGSGPCLSCLRAEAEADGQYGGSD